MANDNVIGLAMGLDVSDLKTGLKEVGKIVQQSRNEFNLATAGLDKWTQSSEGLTAKLDQLNKQLDGQKKVVAGYKAEIERVSKLEGDHSVQLEQLKAKLQKAEAEVKKTESSIKKYSDALDDVNENNRKANSELGKLTTTIKKQKEQLADLGDEYKDAVLTYGKNSKEAKSLKKQIETLTGELDDNEKQLKKSEKALEALSYEFEDAESGAEKFQKGMDGLKGIGAGLAGVVAGIGASVAGLATAFLATAESTKEFRTNMGKIEAGFETAGLKAEQATKTYADLYAVVADEGKATEATAMLGQLAKSQEELTIWTETLTGVYATFGDSLPIENLAEASLETANTGALTGGLADALNWAGVNEEKFQEQLDKCTTVQQRQALITDTLNGLYSETAKKYREVNGEVIESNKAQVDLTATMAKLGEKAEPIMTALKKGFNDVLNTMIGLVDGLDFEAITDSIESAFGYFISDVIPSIIDGVKWIIENKDPLIAGIIAIGTAMLTWNVVTMIQGIVTGIKAWTVATEGMTIAQKLMNLAMNANPIGLIITAIATLTAGIIYLWNTNEDFRKAVINAWNKIKETALTVANSVIKFFTNAWTNIKKVWTTTLDWFKKVVTNIGNAFKNIPTLIKNYFSTAWSNAKKAWSSVSSWFKTTVSNITNAFKNIPSTIKNYFVQAWNNLKSVWSGVTSFFSDIIVKIKNAFTSLPKQLTTIGGQLVSGLWNGISDKTGWIVDKVKGFGNSVVKGIKNFFKIKSPSRLMAEMGGYVAEGFGFGIEDNADLAVKPFEDIGQQIKQKMEKLNKDIEKFNLDKMFEDMGVQLDNPFEGITGQALTNTINNEINPALNELKGKAKEAYSALSGKEMSLDTLQDFKTLESSLVDLAQKQLEKKQMLEAKMKRHIEMGEEGAENYERTQQWIELANKEYETTLSMLGEISPQLEEIQAQHEQLSVPDTRSAWQKWLDNADEAIHGSEEKMEEWANGTGKYLEKVTKMGEQVFSTIGEIGGNILEIINNNIDAQIDALDAELEEFQKAQEEKIEVAEKTHEEENAKAQEAYYADLEALEAKKEQELISDTEYAMQKDLLESNLKAKQTALEEQLKQTKLNAQTELEAKEMEIKKKQNALAQKQFNAQKANDIATTLINGATAIVKGFAQLGPIAGAVNAGVQAGITASQVAVIASKKFVPMLAKGGIVDGATHAIIGEDGREAVLPLEKNTGWMDELARRLSSIMVQDMMSWVTPQQVAPVYAGAPVVNNTFNQTINSPHVPSRKELYRDTKNLLTLRRE